MKQFTSMAAIAGAVLILIGAATQTASVAIAGWVITMLFSVWYLECCNKDEKRRAQKNAEVMRRRHENNLDTYEFSTTLTREQLMRDYDKIRL